MSTSLLLTSLPSSWWSFFLLTTTSYLAYALFTTVYSTFFGPLSHIPGPKLRAWSRFPSIITLITGREGEVYPALHEQYGPVVRIAPNEISYAATSGETWKAIYGAKNGCYKDPNFYMPPVNKVASIADAGKEGHARQRGVLTHAFGDKTLREIEGRLIGWVGKMLGRLEGDQGKMVDMVGLYNCTTFDIMGDIAFATDLQMLSSGQVSSNVKLIFQNIQNASLVRGISNIHPIFQWFFTNVVFESGPVKALLLQHWEYTKVAVDHRLRPDVAEGRKDLWTKVVETGGKEGGLTVEEMYSNASAFMVAGTETTATIMSGATYLLLTHPHHLARLATEIRSTFATYSDMTLDALVRLPFLQAVIKETLRVYPSVPTLLPRVVPKGGVEISNDFLPEGTVVGVHQLATFRFGGNFARAGEFCPERWLQGEEGYGEFEGDRRESFEPFSVGIRGCLGKNLAWHEMRLILAGLVLCFDLELCEESKGWIEQKTFLIWDKRELWCKARKVGEIGTVVG